MREVLGISPGDITREQGEITLSSSLPRTTPSPKTAFIPYGTWECSNGRFNGINGEDWEWWPRNYESISIRNGQQVVADVRLRRDAGYLQLFADVLATEGFRSPVGKTEAATKNFFGKGDGVELLIGPLMPADRKVPIAGDTRVFLTARPDDKGRLQGVALAYRPASQPLAPNAGLRLMDNAGGLQGEAPKGSLNFSKGFEPIPGARVSVTLRPDGKGFRLEAELPLAFFPAIAVVKPVTFKRWRDPGKHFIKSYTEDRFDLDGPVRLNVAVLTTDAAGSVRRSPWMADGSTLEDPATINPSEWGMANAAISLNWAAQPGATEYRIYRADTPELANAKPVQTVQRSHHGHRCPWDWDVLLLADCEGWPRGIAISWPGTFHLRWRICP